MGIAKWLQAYPVVLGSVPELRSTLGLTSAMPARPIDMIGVAAFDFGRMVSARFAKMLQCLAENSNSGMVFVAAVEASSSTAYLDQYGLVPVFGLSRQDLPNKYLEFLNWGPARGGADSLASHSDVLVATCPTLPWVVVGERNFELARLFSRKTFAATAALCVPDDWRYRAEDVEARLVEAGIDRDQARAVAAAF